MQVASDIEELTFGDADVVLERAQRLMSASDVSEVMWTFASIVVVRFADLPETCGKSASRNFLITRFARQKNYRLQQQLLVVSGIACYLKGEWEDGLDGRLMQGRGIKLPIVRGKEIARCEAAFNVWQKGSALSLPIIQT